MHSMIEYMGTGKARSNGVLAFCTGRSGKALVLLCLPFGIASYREEH